MSQVRGATSLDRVLAVVDWSLLLSLPFIVIGSLIEPAIANPHWGWLFVALMACTVGLAIAGLLGYAPWRRRLYAGLVLIAGALALWANGPLLGVGAAFGFATILAAAFNTRTGLILVVLAGFAAILLRMFEATHGVEGVASTTLEFDGFRIWFRVSSATGLFLWFGTRVLEEVTASLEGVFVRAVEAYRTETAVRTQLESSRLQLDELEQVELVGRLAGGVAHDVNNALTAILAASDLLGEDVTTEPQQRSLAELEAASHQAAELVRDLLWIGRKLPPTTDTARVADALTACRARLGRMSRTLELAVDIAAELRVVLPPEQLEQLLFWLLIRAHRIGIRQLEITGRVHAGMIRLDVRGGDRTGAPSTSLSLRPAAVHARLSTAAATEVVRQVGGTLTWTELGELLVVELCLPAAPEDRPAEPRRTARNVALVVDDEPLVLRRLARLVAGRGYVVLTAGSLAEAWPRLAEDPDVLITDLQLGDGRGEELAVASFARVPGRPIIVCSGFGADDALCARLAGAHLTFLPKPFTHAELEVALPLAAIGSTPARHPQGGT